MAKKSKVLSQVTIATSGTRQQITSSSINCYSIIIQADASNTGAIYIGDSTVSSSNGFTLNPRESLEITPDGPGENEVNLSDVYLDTATNGNIARIQYITGRGN